MKKMEIVVEFSILKISSLRYKFGICPSRHRNCSISAKQSAKYFKIGQKKAALNEPHQFHQFQFCLHLIHVDFHNSHHILVANFHGLAHCYQNSHQIGSEHHM